jgi:hypothetical protein
MKRRLIQEISPSQRGWNNRSTYAGFLKNNEFLIKPTDKPSRYREILEIKGYFQETEEGSIISIKMIRNRYIFFVYLIFLLLIVFSLVQLINEEARWIDCLFSLFFFCSFLYGITFHSLSEAIERQYRDIAILFDL